MLLNDPTMQQSEALKNNAWLLNYAKNFHSQCGEDGIIAKALELLPERDSWCVEFGAWDGRNLSNTCHLIEEQNYNSVLIEGNSLKAKELQKNFAHNPKVHTICQIVDWEGEHALQRILAKTPIPNNFDLLSIGLFRRNSG